MPYYGEAPLSAALSLQSGLPDAFVEPCNAFDDKGHGQRVLFVLKTMAWWFLFTPLQYEIKVL